MSSNVLSREFIYNPCFLFSLREANKLHSIIKKRKQSDEQKPTYADRTTATILVPLHISLRSEHQQQ